MNNLKQPTKNQKIGRIGEEIAVKYLENMGYFVIEQNYLKKYGEIDIIAKNQGILHFVEVKSVSCEIPVEKVKNVPQVTNGYRPEDNLHSAKLKRLTRTIQAYLFEKIKDVDIEWQFDAIIVRLDSKTKQARVKMLQNIIL